MQSIYKITSPTGSIYVGKTKDIDKRFSYYKNISCKTQVKLYNSLKKHGWENHTFEVLETVEDSNVSQREIYWIGLLKTNYKRFPKNNGMNLTDGGENNTGNNIVRVYEYTIDGVFKSEWASQTDAVNYYNLPANRIAQACKGKLKTTNGSRWSYVKVDNLGPLKWRKDCKHQNIVQLDSDENIIARWANTGEIIRSNPDYQYAGIINCLKMKRPTYKSFKWSYDTAF